MRVFITGDANWESGVGRSVEEICGPTRAHFASRDYGSGLAGIGVILMCRNPELGFKRRMRFVQAERMLDLDIMLELAQMRSASPKSRWQTILDRLGDEIPATVHKYCTRRQHPISDFDEARFVEDWRVWLNELARRDPPPPPSKSYADPLLGV